MGRDRKEFEHSNEKDHQKHITEINSHNYFLFFSTNFFIHAQVYISQEIESHKF
jgi:hypothetical protein